MILILIVTVVLSVLIVKQFLKRKRLPPGPFAYPLIGSIPQLFYYIWREKGVVPAFDYFRRKYGNVFTLWLGPIPYVSICDYEISHEVFVKNGNNYKHRDVISIFKEYNEGHGFFGSNIQSWAEMRKFTLLTFRNMGIGKDLMEDKIMSELNARCADLDAQSVDGKTVIKAAEFFDLTVGSVINSLLVGKRFDESNKNEFLKLRELMLNQAENFTSFDLFVPAWFLKKFFPRRYEALVGTQVKVNEYVMRDAIKRLNEIRKGQYTVNPEDPQDYIDAFLGKMIEEEKHGRNSFYTMKCLEVVLGDLWGAGQDTTSGTLLTGFNLLVHHPEVIVKLREELMKVTDNGARSVSLKDRAVTDYLNATIAEIQRHASVLNVSFWKVAEETTTVREYTVDAGTLITAQLSTHHTNENVFRNPHSFRPERFLENEKLQSQLIQFGIGKRSCVGENLARAELYLMFGNLLLRYDVKPANGKFPAIGDQLPYTDNKMADKSSILELQKLKF